MTAGGKRQRLFIALDLPDPIRAGVAAWGAEELVDPALRPVREESLHVTLVFLGSRGEGETEALARLVRETDSPAALLKLEDPISLPRRKRASLFALPAPSPATTETQAVLIERLDAAGLHEPEERDFWPHVTIARVRSEGRGKRRPMPVAKRPGDLPKPLKEPFYCVRLTLYRSELQPGGARYVPLAQVELP